MPTAEHIQREIEQSTKILLDQATAMSFVGWKPHFSDLGAKHTQLLLHRGVIKLPMSPAGVRCKMELSAGTFSRASHRFICSLLDRNN